MNQTLSNRLRPFDPTPSPAKVDDLILELADKIETLPPHERRWILRRIDDGHARPRTARFPD
jgi:hypothetical protein